MKLDRYTEKAQGASIIAQRMATDADSPVLDVEHILAALLDDPDGIPAATLRALNADPAQVGVELAAVLGRRAKVAGGSMSVDPRTQELIRRAEGGKAHAFATPLLTKADGSKYGKTDEGALWLDPTMLSPYAFHQFWLNIEDEKVPEMLRVFTFFSREEIEDLEEQTREKPFLRAGQKALRARCKSTVESLPME